jgi:hypothetical protein
MEHADWSVSNHLDSISLMGRQTQGVIKRHELKSESLSIQDLELVCSRLWTAEKICE